eukprot:14894-Heterococcus_DN1.PRE.1
MIVRAGTDVSRAEEMIAADRSGRQFQLTVATSRLELCIGLITIDGKFIRSVQKQQQQAPSCIALECV